MDEMRKFLASIYLGDRFCEKLEIGDGKIVFHINLLSRLREGTLFSFAVRGCSVSKDAVSTDIALYIKAGECYILGPENGEKIYK